MSIEMNSLLANAAPRPQGNPDVAAIMKKGSRMRVRRMVALGVAVPVVAAALWAGAQTGLTRPIVTPPAADPYCDWNSEALMVFLDGDSTPAEGRALARQVRRLDHVASVEWNDLFEEKAVTINSDIPRASERLRRRAFPPWLDIRLDDPSFAGEVADSLPASPVIDAIAGGNVRMDECRTDRLEKQNSRLRRQVRRLNERLHRQLRPPRERFDSRTSMIEIDASSGVPANPAHRRLWDRVNRLLGRARQGARTALGSGRR